MHFFCTSLYEIWEVYWGPYGAILQKIYSRKYLLVVPVQCTCTVVPIPARSMNFLGSIQLYCTIVQIMCMIFVKNPFEYELKTTYYARFDKTGHKLYPCIVFVSIHRSGTIVRKIGIKWTRILATKNILTFSRKFWWIWKISFSIAFRHYSSSC